MSASISRVEVPALAQRAARWAERVVFPSPPVALVIITQRPCAGHPPLADRHPEVVQALDEPGQPLLGLVVVGVVPGSDVGQRGDREDLVLDPRREQVGVGHPARPDLQQDDQPQDRAQDADRGHRQVGVIRLSETGRVGTAPFGLTWRIRVSPLASNLSCSSRRMTASCIARRLARLSDQER